MTLSVTPDRLSELKELLQHWLHRRGTAKKREIQSLVGKLCFVAKCVRQSRIFLNRILVLLRSAARNHHRIRLTIEFRKDILWWYTFIDRYNGVSLIPQSMAWSNPDYVFASDSCLTGCGGHTSSDYFHSTFPDSILEQELPIHCLEMLAVLLSLRLWAATFSTYRILIYCDNMPTVEALCSGRSRDSFMCSCLRDICFLASMHDFEISAVHLPGVDNRLADCLSRWHLSSQYSSTFFALTAEKDMFEWGVTDDLFLFSCDW